MSNCIATAKAPAQCRFPCVVKNESPDDRLLVEISPDLTLQLLRNEHIVVSWFVVRYACTVVMMAGLGGLAERIYDQAVFVLIPGSLERLALEVQNFV
jgi:hypothetical protein